MRGEEDPGAELGRWPRVSWPDNRLRFYLDEPAGEHVPDGGEQDTPSPQAMRVVSVTQSRFGPAAVNFRVTRSNAGVCRGSCFVEPPLHPRRRNAPCQPWPAISLDPLAARRDPVTA